MVAGSGSRQAERLIRRVTVLGAGTMGSRIAAHLANSGVQVLLLDLAADGNNPAARSRPARTAIEALRKAKPPAFYSADDVSQITPGNFEDDIPLIADSDWIIEAVAENLEIKRALLQRVDGHRRLGTPVTTNTSGLPVASIVAGMSEDLRRHWFGTHFFNPPRYMRLVEVITTPETNPEDVEAISRFCDRRLGKTVVPANDTPNFIANRIGTFVMLNSMRLMAEQGLSIEEVDTLTGETLGWPKTGTFRLGDMVGVDVLAHVADNFAAQAEKIGDERADVTMPAFMQTMLERNWLGDKTHQGFYKKAGTDQQGIELRLALDLSKLEYRPSVRARFPSLELLKNVERTTDRLPQLLPATTKDRAFEFYWSALTELFTYAANRLPPSANAIAQSVVEIDTAMKTGFNWELGPFEMFDAVGVRATTERMRATGQPIAATVETLLRHGESWYRDDSAVQSGRRFFDPVTATYKPILAPEGTISLAAAKKAGAVVHGNAGASVVDLGDGIAAIELHSKRNAIGDDIVSLVTRTFGSESEQVARFDAFVITGEGANFSVGANLMQLLLTMQEQEWDELDFAIRAFQGMTQAIKFCPRPVVVAPFGMCLGGGTEMALHAAARHPHAELYMGLVETGVGLIPAGGGCKEMLLRALDAAAGLQTSLRGDETEVADALKKSFEAIATAKVSTSAADARNLGLLRQSDSVTMNRTRVLSDAKVQARRLAENGYAAPAPRAEVPTPGESVLATLKLYVYLMHEGQFISDHDVKVANWVAYALCGGNTKPGTRVSEQYLLDLEREAFLSLCGEKKTQERIAYTLKTGKPLRN